jgi:ribosome recycling factor
MPIAAPVEKIVQHVQQSVQQTIKQAVQQAVKDIVVSPAQPIIIHNLTINYYNAPIGQTGSNTTITGLDNLIQDNHGTMNF